jgi:hypothetical protein
MARRLGQVGNFDDVLRRRKRVEVTSLNQWCCDVLDLVSH